MGVLESGKFSLADFVMVRLSFARWMPVMRCNVKSAMSSVPQSDVAYRMLRLEQQLESYQRLHAEELAEIRRALDELKLQMLSLDSQRQLSADEEPTGAQADSNPPS